MAAQGFFDQHWLDMDGNPAGGVSTGKGFTISWQNGPLGKLGTDGPCLLYTSPSPRDS